MKTQCIVVKFQVEKKAIQLDILIFFGSNELSRVSKFALNVTLFFSSVSHAIVAAIAIINYQPIANCSSTNTVLPRAIL